MIMNTWQFHLLNWQGVGPLWVISFSFVYTGLLVWTFLQWHKLNLIYCLKSFLLLPFCFLLVWMVDQTQMYPSPISPLKDCFRRSYVIFIVWPPPPHPLLIWQLGFLWKFFQGGIKIFFVKMGGSPYSHIGVGWEGCL